jgi:hypothetical protein
MCMESYHDSLQFRARMRGICDTAPEAAQDFAKVILEISGMGATESATNPSTLPGSTTRDLSYRPPRSARIAEKSG